MAPNDNVRAFLKKGHVARMDKFEIMQNFAGNAGRVIGLPNV